MVKSMKNLLTMKKMMANIIEIGARMSEKQIDDYIDSMEEKNQIYVEEELNYASKCHNLEEQIGCPLEVRCAVVPDSFIYTFGTTMENQDVVTQRHIVTISKEGFTILYATTTGKERKMELSWKAYKKTWWLRKDKSE